MHNKICHIVHECISRSLTDQSAHGETKVGRFQNITELRLAGLDLTDASSRLLVRYVPHLTRLDLSHCGNVTDQTVHTLTSPISPMRETLTHINLAGKCTPETDLSIPFYTGGYVSGPLTGLCLNLFSFLMMVHSVCSI